MLVKGSDDVSTTTLENGLGLLRKKGYSKTCQNSIVMAQWERLVRLLDGKNCLRLMWVLTTEMNWALTKALTQLGMLGCQNSIAMAQWERLVRLLGGTNCLRLMWVLTTEMNWALTKELTSGR
eukprot:gene4791-3437_t